MQTELLGIGWLKWLRRVVWAAFFFFGKRGRKDGGRMPPSLADALEAVIASIYLSFGLEKAAEICFKIFPVPLKDRLAAAGKSWIIKQP